jgi:hypothetical protein
MSSWYNDLLWTGLFFSYFKLLVILTPLSNTFCIYMRALKLDGDLVLILFTNGHLLQRWGCGKAWGKFCSGAGQSKTFFCLYFQSRLINININIYFMYQPSQRVPPARRVIWNLSQYMYILAISHAMSKYIIKHTHRYRNNKTIKREKFSYRHK